MAWLVADIQLRLMFIFTLKRTTAKNSHQGVCP